MYLIFLSFYSFFFHFFNPGNDLDSIRALFSEKEKELSLAVAKVEALTKQLEELRRDRRGPLNLISTAAGVAVNPSANGAAVSVNSLNINGSNNGTTNIQQHLSSTSPAARELDKLRRELMVSKRTHNFMTTVCSFFLLCFHHHLYCRFGIVFVGVPIIIIIMKHTTEKQ